MKNAEVVGLPGIESRGAAICLAIIICTIAGMTAWAQRSGPASGGERTGGTPTAAASSSSPSAYEFKVIFSFDTMAGGFHPTSGLFLDSSGNLYGMTGAGGSLDYGVVFELSPPSPSGGRGWTETVLHSFPTAPHDCADPLYGGLLVDASGNVYYACGDVVSELSFQGGQGGVGGGEWVDTNIYVFDYESAAVGALVSDKSGNIYGATAIGGDYSCLSDGCGAVYELSPPAGGGTGSWTETTLYAFQGGSTGMFPESGVVFDASGNLYGTASSGGNTVACPRTPQIGDPGCGVVYKLSPPTGGSGPWTETVLYAFTGSFDGAYPYQSLVMDESGNLYGTTLDGGDLSCSGDLGPGCGVVFELSPPSSGSGAWTETVLHKFTGVSQHSADSDGFFPVTSYSMAIDPWGNLYGVTFGGGSENFCQSGGCGTVFRVSPPGGSHGWEESILHAFRGWGDGLLPLTSVTMDAAGNLYGTMEEGGKDLCAGGCGTVYELSPVR